MVNLFVSYNIAGVLPNGKTMSGFGNQIMLTDAPECQDDLDQLKNDLEFNMANSSDLQQITIVIINWKEM